MKMARQIFERLLKVRKSFLALCLVFILTACNDDCPTFQEFKAEGSGNNCLLCPLFEVLTQAASKAANSSWNMFASELAVVIMYATALYIAFFTLKMVGSFGKQAFADYLTNDKKGVLVLGFKLAVISLLLTSTFFIDVILVPVLQSGLTIGSSLGTNIVAINWGAGAGGGWDALFTMINEAVKEFNNQIYEHIALGNAMICHSTKGFIFAWYWLMLCYGLIFFIFGWFLLAHISFFIVDMLINLAIGAILLPFGIAFAISGKTVGYTKKIWNIFLYVFFNFVMLGIVLGLSVQLIELAMGKLDENLIPSAGINSFLGEISGLLDANNVKQASEILWTSGCLLLAVVCFWISSKLIDQSKSLAYAISDALGAEGLTDAGSKVGTAGTARITKAGKYIGGHAGNIAMSGVKNTGKEIARITRLDKGLANVRKGVTSMRGVLTGTGRDGYKAWWRK